MPKSDDTRDRILAAARTLLQSRGYAGFSFADLASAVRIRKASVHHHFPYKADLVAALIEGYREQFAAVAEAFAASGADPEAALKEYFGYNRRIAHEGTLICSAGALSAALLTLPPEAREGTARHLEEIERWLTTVIRAGRRSGVFVGKGSARATALMVSAATQGALQAARVAEDPTVFEVVVRQLWRVLRGG